MKVLSIGNSFSQDAHRWLHQLAAANGAELETVNLYIGGCSLETHWRNAVEHIADYDLERNGGFSERKISLEEALSMDTWDVITLQQASYHSGMPQTYISYIMNLTAMIKRTQPTAQLYFHQTWAYEYNSNHGGFWVYNNDQKEMFRRIVDASEMVRTLTGCSIIPVGTVIQRIRETVPEFDCPNGGLSLCRDGFHLSLDYGRFVAAATWYHVLTGKAITIEQFEDFDPVLIKKIVDIVESM